MRVKLEDVCKRIYAGGDVPKDRYSEVKTDEYSVPIYANAEKDEGLYGYTDKAREKELSITVAARGTIGFTSIRREPFLPVVRLITVVPDTKKVSERYLYYVLKNCKSYSTGTSIPQLTVPDIKKKSFELCNIHEQEEIADRLDKANEIIQLRKKELQLLEDLIKARFVEMFGEPKINPRQYPVSELSEYIEFLTSGSRGWAKYCTDDGTEWFITIKNVKDCRISVNNIQSVDAPGNAEAIRTKVQEGDLLISITADLGRTGVVTKEIAEHGAYINQHLTCIRLNKKILDPLYVAYFMESNAGKEQFESKNQSAVKAGLNFNSINSLRIMIPPISVQKEFISFVHQVDKSKLLSLIKLLEQLITYLYNVFIIYRQDKGEEVENHG